MDPIQVGLLGIGTVGNGTFQVLARNQEEIRRRAAVWARYGLTIASWTVRPKWRAMHDHRDAMWQGMMDFVRRRWGRRPG